MRGIQRIALLLSPALSVSLLAPATSAQASELSCKDRTAATSYIKQGREFFDANKLDGALASFRNSRELCPSENNTLNIVLVLKALDRPVEALDMLDVLRRDFPTLRPDNEATAVELRTSLDRIVGMAVFDGDYPGATIIVDGKNVGTIPQARPLRLPIGMHTVKIEAQSYLPLETTFTVLPKETVRVAVSLAPAPTTPQEAPRPPLAVHSMHVGVGLPLSPSLGGAVTDCDDACGAGPGIGALISGGYRYRFTEFLHIGATAGYLFLWQTRSRLGARVLVDGAPQFADVDDDLFLNSFFAGPEISASFMAGGGQFDVGFVLGIMGGPLVNRRTAQEGRPAFDASPTFDLVPPTETPVAGFAGVVTQLQASWRTPWSLAPGWPIHLRLGILGVAPTNVPQYEASFTANFRTSQTPDEVANFGERLIGSWSFVITPGLTVYHDL
ncbi:PEGA domain-containing protein [Polyangium sorediatum]|uniref:PEGA domain-containing protein n=1 Tax=Polyangium sorediatum TaxID=889274 RepID=A0ABT6NNH9_9BACT|nr:PEGA domain-containing protein [Polyangium sorediatum]MDI1429838.1 PEGA domain-containing protein [Polyangium sorediatum]